MVLCNIVLHTFILQDVTPDPGGLYWLRYFLLTNAFVPAPDNFWGNLSATWTISLFVVFYVTAPLWRRLVRGIKSGAAVYLAALVLRYIWAQAECSAYMMVFYYLHFFLLGMLIWQLKEKMEPVQSALALGICGALLPLGILHLIYGKVIEYLTGEFESVFQRMAFLSEHDVFMKLTPLLLGIGVLIGWFGSTSSTRKQLKKISLR